MALCDVLDDDEVNHVLERFDQTAPALQRRIICEFILMNAILAEQKADLLEACQAWLEYCDGLDIGTDPDDPLAVERRRVHGGRVALTREALAKAKA
jgi:hypothetical protein